MGQDDVLAFLEDNKSWWSARRISEALSITRSSADISIRKLVKSGFVVAKLARIFGVHRRVFVYGVPGSRGVVGGVLIQDARGLGDDDRLKGNVKEGCWSCGFMKSLRWRKGSLLCEYCRKKEGSKVSGGGLVGY